MRVINIKCWVDWKTEKGKRTVQASFNVSFQEKKNVLYVTRSPETQQLHRRTQVHSCFSFCWSQCVFLMFTCMVQVSHVVLLSPGGGKGPFLLHVGLLKKVSYVLEASCPQPPGGWLEPGGMPVSTPTLTEAAGPIWLVICTRDLYKAMGKRGGHWTKCSLAVRRRMCCWVSCVSYGYMCPRDTKVTMTGSSGALVEFKF